MTDIATLLAGTEEDIAEVQTRAMEEAGELLKDDWRGVIEAAGLGARLARTVRSRAYPAKGQNSLDPAAFIWTKAPKIIDAFSRGVTIRARDGKWLAWPTPAAGARRITPAVWEKRKGVKLRFIPLRGGRSAILVLDNARLTGRGLAAQNRSTSRNGGGYTRLAGRATVVIFVLHRTSRVKKLFDLETLATRAAARMPALIDKHWSRMPDRNAPMLMDDSGRPIAPFKPWSGPRTKGSGW
ncbi:DUF6441 family protein [Phenylobacterium sp.]|uniref:DUF6441 family protein n=1 Tax=Phenylobacterium sp. TaxID=1871053 RepID=UPI0027323EFC|nr:DUF6441 family protein [Phenylobacterium sp.]MDP3853155.1 DUF6441 family protein [Phenylobacterium sp.]